MYCMMYYFIYFVGCFVVMFYSCLDRWKSSCTERVAAAANGNPNKYQNLYHFLRAIGHHVAT